MLWDISAIGRYTEISRIATVGGGVTMLIDRPDGYHTISKTLKTSRTLICKGSRVERFWPPVGWIGRLITRVTFITCGGHKERPQVHQVLDRLEQFRANRIGIIN